MKISEMLEREDFYSILPRTLTRYADFLGIEPGSVMVVDKGKADLYVIEKLNAIISGRPSTQVKDYLRTEFSVSGSILRRLAVSAYLNTSFAFVPGFASRRLRAVMANGADDVLIYPCNKKIRLFDFASGTVHTVLKDGFPDLYIKREMEFRLTVAASFIPGISNHADGCYSEKIILNGRPLARIRQSSFVEEKKRESLDLLRSLTIRPRKVRTKEYVSELQQRCMTMLAAKEGFACGERVSALFDSVRNRVQDCEMDLITSHGDFQPGNIWLDENGRIIIIDWETVKERSPFYDYAALFCSLRNHGGLKSFCGRVLSDNYLSAVDGIPSETVLMLILAEELEYQTEEFISFPGAMGLDIYMDKIVDFETVI